MDNIPFSTGKCTQHSKSKKCCCGGHNASNAKSNLKHNSTMKKLSIRKSQKIELHRRLENCA